MLNESETPVGHSFTPRQLRMLKASVIIMGVLLVVGFGLLLIGIYLQATKISKAPPGAPTAAAPQTLARTLSLPVETGAEVRDILLDQGRLILHLRREGGSEIAVIDLASGRETQRITLSPRQ